MKIRLFVLIIENSGSVLYIHDGAEAEGLQKGEIGGLREAGPANAVIHHSEIERRDEKILAVVDLVTTIGGGGVGGDGRREVVGDTQLDLPAHLGVLFLLALPLLRLLVMVMMMMKLNLEFCYFHIKSNQISIKKRMVEISGARR